MRIRVICCSAFFMFILFSFAGNSAFATEAEVIKQSPSVSTIELTATVPANFDKTILINFVPVGQENVMARLDKVNNYVFSQEVKPGTYKVDFINIVGENASDFDINTPEQIVIKQGDTAKFQLKIGLKATTRKPIIKTEPEPIPGSIVQPVPAKANGSAISSVPVPDAIKDVLTPAVQPSPSREGLNSPSINTLISIAATALVVLLFFFYKQMRYKHEYYDC